jgi:RNA polymerase sigma factor (sigma-70 family)
VLRLNEGELVDLVKSGNDHAFTELVKPYIVTSKKTAYLLLYDYELAQDAVQEALIQAHQSIYRYDSNRALFKTWFNRIVVNCSLKILRKKRFLPFLYVENKLVDSDTPEKKWIQDEETNQIYQCVNQLTIKLKTVLILYYFQELTVKEISQTLDISEGTVKSRLFKSREQLKKLLKNEEQYLSLGGEDYGA